MSPFRKSPLQKFVHGSIDFLGNSLPELFGMLVKSRVKQVTRRIQRTENSPFALVRYQDTKTAAVITVKALHIRANHVPTETGFMVLKDSGRVRDVEYVVQEHDATGWEGRAGAGRHFDLRVHLKDSRGRLQAVSWAIPMKGKRAGLSEFPKPGEKFLAVRQPDHNPSFSKFSGRIPEGEFGAGTVKIWAKGLCDVHKVEGGNLHFSVFSGPAKGGYVLVSTQGKQGLILGKKPEAVDGWQKPTYAKRDEDLLEGLEQEGGYVAERKVDGASVELRLGERGIQTFSHRVSKRTGTLVEHTDRLVHLDRVDVGGNAGTRLRAEAWHRNGVNFLAGTLNSNVDRAREIQKTAGPVKLDVFDITHYKGRDVRGLPYAERRAIYEGVCRDLGSPHVTPVRQTQSNFKRFYEQQVSLKSAPTDGIVLKRLEAAYPQTEYTQSERDPKGSTSPWIKVKPSDTVDCRIVSFSEGTGRLRGSLGAFTCETPEGKRVQVGSGFSDRQRNWIWDHRKDLADEVARISFHVRAGERTATGPRFDSWHPDRSEVGPLMHMETT